MVKRNKVKRKDITEDQASDLKDLINGVNSVRLTFYAGDNRTKVKVIHNKVDSLRKSIVNLLNKNGYRLKRLKSGKLGFE